jgi:outer membrane protein assembly factor BamB
MPSRRRVLAATAGALTSGLAGCSHIRSDDTPEVSVQGDVVRSSGFWPSFNGHNANTGYSPDGTAIESNPSVAWRAPVEASDGYPVVGWQHVFYPGYNVLRAFDVANGTERWSRTVYELDEHDNKYELGVSTPPVFPHRVGVDGGPDLVAVGVAGERNELRAYTVDGDLAWRTPTPSDGKPAGAPAYEPRTNRICVGTTAERVLCVEARTGDPVWSRRVFGAVEAAPAVDEAEVVVTTTAGEVYGLATDDGQGLWRASVDASIHCSPTVAGALTMVLDDTGRLYGFESSGGVAWSNDAGAAILYPGLTTDGEQAYFVTNDGRRGDELVSADVRTGERRWSVRTGGTAGGNLPVVVDDTVYTTGVDSVAAFAAGEVGALGDRERWRWRPDGSVYGPVVAADGRLFVPVSDEEEHELVALE